MFFNSYIFIFVFFPITCIGYFILARFKLVKLAVVWLAMASLSFYVYANFFLFDQFDPTPQYLILLIISIFLNYQISRLIVAAKPFTLSAKIFLWLGILVNLSILAYYKYANFALTLFNNLFNTDWPAIRLMLPLGISFYTFNQIAYLVDTYKGERENQNSNLLTYHLFVSFFPYITSGPIVRYHQIAPQLRKLKNFLFCQENFAKGLTWFCLGLAKKVIIADNISAGISTAFLHANQLNFLEAWMGALSYTMQLYFDFSGYSDMAIGLGLMLNIQLPINFNSPYKSISITDFWRRWHISLSNFLRDYLYIPFGGSRRGEIRRYANLLLTMLLGGLWHGAGLTFIVWGLLHGIYLCINHAWRQLNLTLPQFIGWLITIGAVIISWVFFRAANLSDAVTILKTMIGLNGIVLPFSQQGKLSFLQGLGFQLKSLSEFEFISPIYGSKSIGVIVILFLLFWVVFLPNTQELIKNLKPSWWLALPVGVITSISLLSLNRVAEFLYFQF